MEGRKKKNRCNELQCCDWYGIKAKQDDRRGLHQPNLDLRRNSKRAREENPGEPVFAQSVVKCGRHCVLSSTWFSLHKGRTMNVAKAGLKAVLSWSACACAEPQCRGPALLQLRLCPAHATPSLEPVLTLGPASAHPVPSPCGTRRSHEESQSPACPGIHLRFALLQMRVALA